MADVEEQLTKLRIKIEELVETCAEKNPDYAERLRAQLDSVQPGLDELQDQLSDAEMGGEPPDDEPEHDESEKDEHEE
ncbi:MAG TPA: hypothetical protein VFX24_14165 [Ktedonobacterales bacterium]|nr:hypothetical protein [Ktedonobacterales bacterium]